MVFNKDKSGYTHTQLSDVIDLLDSCDHPFYKKNTYSTEQKTQLASWRLS